MRPYIYTVVCVCGITVYVLMGGGYCFVVTMVRSSFALMDEKRRREEARRGSGGGGMGKLIQRDGVNAANRDD